MSSPPGQILPTDTPEKFQRAVECAAALLRAGEVVALPTETVYGLAANALNPAAVAQIFKIKGRPAHNPIIVHACGLEMAGRCAAEWPELAQKLADGFWPGPLTLVLPRAREVPDIVTAGGPTVGIRWPSHPFVQAVIDHCGFPLAAPSANLSNRVSPTTASHVLAQLGDRVSLIVDGGPSQVGIESTVLDLTVAPPRVLRPGMIHEQALRAVTGELGGKGTAGGALRSPGLMPKHYAPRARLVIWSWRDQAGLLTLLEQAGVPPARISIIAHTQVPSGKLPGRVSVVPHDAEAFARALYAELHNCDEAGAELIAVEALPAGDEWKAIADRLSRAASATP